MNDFYAGLFRESLKRAGHRVWIFSDLQQSNPDYARECMELSMEDFWLLGRPADMMWYLGDAVEGCQLSHLEKMTAMQVDAFEKTGIPLCFVMGNHEMEYPMCREQREKPVSVPFWEAVRAHDTWFTTDSFTDWYFKVPLGDNSVYFLSDHIAPDKSWLFFHGQNPKENYPYFDRYEKLRAEWKGEQKDIITCCHYSFPGGNRAAESLAPLLPLTENHKIHFYGHAHIGDYRWARENAHRRISWIDWHDIPQIEVSSFEHIRGNTCRSVFLHIYEDNSMGIFFRDHDHRVFTECYFPANKRYCHCAEAFETPKP